MKMVVLFLFRLFMTANILYTPVTTAKVKKGMLDAPVEASVGSSILESSLEESTDNILARIQKSL